MFLGAPQMLHYKKKGSVSGLHFTNQDCVIRDNNGKSYLKFPHFHGDYLPIGYVSGSLKEVRVRPYYSDFLVIVLSVHCDARTRGKRSKTTGGVEYQAYGTIES